MAETLYLPIDVETNRVLNVDGVTNRRRLEFIQGETYNVFLKFLSGNASYTPSVDEFSFVVRESASAATDLIAVTGISETTGSYPFTFSFDASSVGLNALLDEVDDYADYSAQIVYTDGGAVEIIAPVTARFTAVATGSSSFDYVPSINGLTGALTMTGAGSVTVSAAGSVLTISGSAAAGDDYAAADLAATGAALQSQITTLAGETGNFTLRSETGAFYPASNPAGYITGVDLSAYATAANLSATGAALASRVSTLEGQTGNFVSQSETGAFYAASNPEGFITAAALAPYTLTSALNATGAALESQISALQGATGGYVTAAQTGALTGQFVSRTETGNFGGSDIPADVVRTTGNQYIGGDKYLTGFVQAQGGLEVLHNGNGRISSYYGYLFDDAVNVSLDWNARTLGGNWTAETPSAGNHVANKDYVDGSTGALTGSFVSRYETGNFGGNSDIPADVVRTTGAQNIGGGKTFTNSVFIGEGMDTMLSVEPGANALFVYDGGGGTVFDAAARQLYDASSNASLAFSDRILSGNWATAAPLEGSHVANKDYVDNAASIVRTSGEQTLSGAKTFLDIVYGTDFDGTAFSASFSVSTDLLFFNQAVPVGGGAMIDLTNACLQNAGEVVTLDWQQSILSGNWRAETPISDGHVANKTYVDASVNGAIANVVRTTGQQTISGEKTFTDTVIGSGILAEWVRDSDGQQAIYLRSGHLVDAGGAVSANWNQRFLYNNGGNDVLNWQTKTLSSGWNISAPTITNSAETQQTLTCSTGVSWNLNNGGAAKLTVTGNPTVLNPTNTRNGATYVLEIIQGTGNSVVSWASNFVWAGGTAPTITATSGKRDIVTLYCSNSKLYGTAVQNFA